MGVSALFASASSGLLRRIPDLDLAIFDSGNGVRKEMFRVNGDDPVLLRFVGIRIGRRYYRYENLQFMRLASKLGGFGTRICPGLRCIAESKVVCDVSGGDSFTDMYPDDRIEEHAGYKELVLDSGLPLVLLPQTYGPFDKSLERATRIVRNCEACFARDERSFETLKTMLGSEFDPDRHRSGVDMAFGLEARKPQENLHSDIQDWIDDGASPLVGFNVSGLIGRSPETGREHYGFKADYRAVLLGFFTELLSTTDSRVVLIPHVMSPYSEESDSLASQWVIDALPREYADRIRMSSVDLDQCEVKWLISKMDWFCGTRMHATIAALSSEVPTATISYSDKALGVFESCGQGGEVFDPRVLGSNVIVEALIDAFHRRVEVKASLTNSIGRVRAQASSQMDEIAEIVRAAGSR